MDITSLLEAGASLGLATALCFQAIKPFPDYWIFGDKDHPLHDPVMRLLLYVTAVVLVLFSTLSALPHGGVIDWAGAWTVAKTAAGAWTVAFFSYHALSGSILSMGKGKTPADPVGVPMTDPLPAVLEPLPAVNVPVFPASPPVSI